MDLKADGWKTPVELDFEISGLEGPGTLLSYSSARCYCVR
jgi:hypothetical protein